jgi:hypothetical protein
MYKHQPNRFDIYYSAGFVLEQDNACTMLNPSDQITATLTNRPMSLIIQQH